MSRRLANRGLPWWMYVAGLSYIANAVFFYYLTLWGPAEMLGFVATYDDAMVIHSVDPDTEVAKGGLRAGDRVIMMNDLPIRNVRDWTAANGNSQAGRTERWLVVRGNERVTLEITPVAKSLRTRLAQGYAQVLSLELTGYFLGFLIAWKRPTDPVARIGAWFIITVSIAPGLPMGWAVLWRSLPALLQFLMWFPQISRFVLEGIFLSFFVLFPRRIAQRRWVWLAIWVPVLITLPWRFSAFYGVIYPNQVSPVPGWILQVGFIRTMLYFFIGIAILAVSYRRFLDANEKRRVRILIVGTIISVMAAMVTVWLDGFSGRMTGVWNVFVYFVVPLYSACPLSLAYAILRHRVLDISVIIRQGLQYALARGGVIGFVPALAGFFVLDLSVNSNQRVGDIFRSRGWIYGTAAALSLVAYWKRQQWLAGIDQRFFRERYDAQHVLREIVGEIRTAQDFEGAAARVVERIETALHPESVFVMVHMPGDFDFRPVASFPSTQAPPRLLAESKLVALLHVLGKPLESLSGESGWLDQRLPREESEFIRRARIDLLVPIAMQPTGTRALLALGIKRSEEPYTRDDQQLLEAIATSLALLLGNPSAGRPGIRFQECPECGTCYDSTTTSCQMDSVQLIPMRFPRMLAGRYRLDRKRGHGGMGTVYEATDNSLERRVAIKLIRDDWVDSVEAVQRFRREARAAAGFTHPNVVTIFDYGVDDETRAFLVMELLEGRTLREELNGNRRLAPARMLEIFRGICAAVEAAHQRNLIHRDLKPENVFIVKSLEGNEVVKILDFGVAKFLPAHHDTAVTRVSNATQTGVLIGTPAYMSPEQLLGHALDTSWDLWALTVMAYEALTGALPFGSSSGDNWPRSVLAGTFAPLNALLDNPPEEWQSFFAEAFAENPALRPSTAAEFLRRLNLILSWPGGL